MKIRVAVLSGLAWLLLPTTIHASPQTHSFLDHDKEWIALTAASGVAAALDIHATARAKDNSPYFHESNPLARPVTNLPTPAYVVTSAGLAAVNAYAAYRMKHSRTWLRKVWWLPQVLQFGGNLWGYSTTRRSWQRACVRSHAYCN